MKKFSTAMAISLVMAICAASAMGWGSATHAYIDEHINNKGPLLTLNQVYGGMAADVFNFMADPQYQPYLATQAHCGGFNKMWRIALLPTAKAQAFGFISHNQKWAADFFAHNYSCPPDNYLPTTGYIQIKAEALYNTDLNIKGLVDSLGYGLGMELLRDVIEYAVDILILRQDAAIGQKVTFAALLRSAEFPLLLNSTYAWDFSRAFSLNYFQATRVIAASESQFRQTMIAYGQILAQGEAAATAQIPAQLALLAEQLFGITINPSDIANVIDLAKLYCEGDYMDAVDNGINDTIDSVSERMQSHGFSY